ncbi:MAG: cusS 3, partial [Variovorax sp.]|nr:cusS 3 [Variovorax sp.]
MYSKQLRDIPRTTSFRIALLFLAVFGAAAAAVIAYLYWQTAGYLAREVDVALTAQMDRWGQLAPDALVQEVSRRTVRDTALRQPAAVFSASGERLAGVIDPVRQIATYDRPFDMRLKGPDGDRPIRAVARVLDSGLVLVAGQDVYAMREFDELLVHAMGGAAALIFPAGLIGALALGLTATRRLDATTCAIERIVEGRLSERLPIRGNHDDVDRLAIVVNRMLDEIERLLSEVKGVTDDVAHDLRTPLTRMLAGLEYAENYPLTRDEYAEVVAQTGAQARLLLRMFQALLHISDIENRVQPSDLVPVSLERIAADAFELFEPA